jgi:hypothetical protein
VPVRRRMMIVSVVLRHAASLFAAKLFDHTGNVGRTGVSRPGLRLPALDSEASARVTARSPLAPL